MSSHEIELAPFKRDTSSSSRIDRIALCVFEEVVFLRSLEPLRDVQSAARKSIVSGCLDLICGVQTEVSVLPIYKNMPTFDTSLQTFRASGFEVSGLYALSEERFPHAVEFDCIYLPKAS